MLIVDMPMPKNCGECPFVTPYSRCVFIGNYAIDENRRAENCPIKGELVRCGECKHKDAPCPEYVMNGKNNDWFCADGERKDGEK